MTITKANLVERVIALGIPEKTAKNVVQTIIDSVGDSLKSGSKAQFSGFGCFKIKERKERMGRNPRTGEVVKIETKRVPVFVASEELKEAVK